MITTREKRWYRIFWFGLLCELST